MGTAPRKRSLAVVAVLTGLLDGILADIKPGDYLLISFGHNDEKVPDSALTWPATV